MRKNSENWASRCMQHSQVNKQSHKDKTHETLLLNLLPIQRAKATEGEETMCSPFFAAIEADNSDGLRVRQVREPSETMSR